MTITQNYKVKDIETTLEQLKNEVNQERHRTRAAKKTFISLGYFLTGDFKENFEYITPQEEDLIIRFRKLPSDIKDLFAKSMKDAADTLGPLKKNPDINDSLADLKEGIHTNAAGRCNIQENHIDSGYCYIGIDTNWHGYYKIGKTIDPTCKRRMVQSINPNFKVIYRTKDFLINALGLEAKIHDELSNKRFTQKGCTEWFNLSQIELNKIVEKYNFVKLEELKKK